MVALVVFESMFGNTRNVAQAVADGIATRMPVEVVEVGEAPDPGRADIDLLVVGAPTHALGLSRESTRADAAARSEEPVISERLGVREWLDGASRCTVPAAAFDTHASHPNLPGRAGRRAERRLSRIGCRVVHRSESFYVAGMEGPLEPGELDRARQWGSVVADAALTASGRG